MNRNRLAQRVAELPARASRSVALVEPDLAPTRADVQHTNQVVSATATGSHIASRPLPNAQASHR